MVDRKHAARHIVMVHGAWQGGWAFGAWAPMLAERGWHTHAVDLPGNGWPPNADAPANLETYTAHVEAVVRSIGEPVVLLGHSGGGMTVSQVAEAAPDCVAALVYLAGMMLPSQMAYGELVRDVAASQPEADLSGITQWLAWNADRTATSVPAEGALRCFVQDCEPQAARQAAGLLRPQPESGRTMRNHLTAERFGRVPRFYVECLDDRSVRLPLQRRMQELVPGATCLSMDCGHVPQLAQPEALTALLMPRLEALLDL